MMVSKLEESKLIVANLNLQPVWHWVPPSANFLPRRKQTFTLSGRSDGSCVHTTILSRHRTPHGGRASSLNVQCDPSDAHEGEVCNIWAPESSDESLRWVTAGADGKVKLWRLHPAEVAKPSRIIPDVEAVAGSISCLFTSTIVEYPFPNRSDLIKRRQAEAPDPVILARCDVRHGVLCGVTKDGDLRVWFGVDTPNRREVRLDCNAAESFNSGGVKRMELEVRRSSIGLVASILVHHDRSASFARFDVTDRGHGESSINVKVYTSSDSAPITTLQAHLQPTAPISMPSHPSSALPEHVTPIEAATEGLASPSVLLRPTGALLPATSDFGRLIVAGHQDGAIRVWSWDGLAVEGAGKLLRVWTAASGKITAVDFSCGLLAIGR